MAYIDEDGEILVFNRHTARDFVFKYVFCFAITGEAEDVYEKIENLDFTPDDKGYILQVANDIITHLGEIDEKIESLSEKWRKGRISNVCLAAMRVAIYEIMFMEEIPKSVSINEAIELIKTYDSPQAASFGNGILGKL